MIPLSSPALERLSDFLGKYDLRSTVTQLAGLLTVPILAGQYTPHRNSCSPSCSALPRAAVSLDQGRLATG